MAGQTHLLITRLIEQGTDGKSHQAALVKIKLIMNGIDPEHHTETSEDSPIVIARLYSITKDMSINL